jgi:hypothetical protein
MEMHSIGRTAAALLLAVGLTTGIVAAQQLDAAQPAVTAEETETLETDVSEGQGASELVEECKAERGEPGEDDRGIGECVSEAVHERNEARQEERAAEKEQEASNEDQVAAQVQSVQHGRVEKQGKHR